MKLTKAISSTTVDALEAVTYTAGVVVNVAKAAQVASETLVIDMVLEQRKEVESLAKDHDLSIDEAFALVESKFDKQRQKRLQRQTA